MGISHNEISHNFLNLWLLTGLRLPCGNFLSGVGFFNRWNEVSLELSFLERGEHASLHSVEGLMI